VDEAGTAAVNADQINGVICGCPNIWRPYTSYCTVAICRGWLLLACTSRNRGCTGFDFMVRFETPGIKAGVLTPAACHQTWVRTLPWILLSELNHAINHPDGDPLAHEKS
jgi:hypothetical protein